jgi:hypothetical protein
LIWDGHDPTAEVEEVKKNGPKRKGKKDAEAQPGLQ